MEIYIHLDQTPVSCGLDYLVGHLATGASKKDHLGRDSNAVANSKLCYHFLFICHFYITTQQINFDILNLNLCLDNLISLKILLQ